MPDTRKSLADVITDFATTGTNAITAQRLRDFVVSVYGADSLFTDATKTASFTAVAGSMYPIDLSAATANIDITFPGSPVAGDTFGVYVAVPSTTAGGSGFAQAPYWGVEPLTSTDINNVAFVQSTGDGVGKWGLMLVGESLVFRWDAVTSTWIVIRDGRKQYQISTKMSGSITTNTAATWKNLDMDTLIGTDPAGMLDATAGVVEIKRANDYAASIKCAPAAALADTKYFQVGIGTTSITPLTALGIRQSTSSALIATAFSYTLSLSAGSTVYGMFKAEETDRGAIVSDSGGVVTAMSLMEIL